MKRSRRTLELAGIIRRYELLTEGEDDAGADDLFGDSGDEGGDDSGDEGGDDSGDEGEDGDVDEGEGDGEEAEEEEEPIESLTPDEIAKYGPGEIEKVIDERLEGFFMASQKSAAVRQAVSAGYPGQAHEEEVVESFLHRSPLSRLLLEEEEEIDQAVQAEVDLVAFASDVHNLMMNYENLLDMEGMIFTKARQYIINQIDEETADEMEELLALRHGWDPEEKYDISGSQNTMVAPPASGAVSNAVADA